MTTLVITLADEFLLALLPALDMTFAVGFLLALLPALATYAFGNAGPAVRQPVARLLQQASSGGAGKSDTAFRDPRVWAHTGHLLATCLAAHNTGRGALITSAAASTRRTR